MFSFSGQQSNRPDLSARASDLTRAVLDLTSTTGALNCVVQDVAKWLARERIANTEFQYCLAQARAITFPNENGLQIRQSLLKSESRFKTISGLPLIQSGSVGRWTAFDADFCYMFTIVAAVMVHHEFKYAADVLCSMIVDGEGTQERVEASYSIRKTRLRPVLLKIVESIALNVVNSGDDLGLLPDPFANLCVHVTSASAFAAVVMAI